MNKAIKSYRQVVYNGITYRQRLRITNEVFDELQEKIKTEILLKLPHKEKYVFTSGYEIFLKQLKVIGLEKSNIKISFLNQTQLRFINLYLKLKLSNMNTYLYIE